MRVQKVSVSIPQQLFDFIEEYQESHHYASRSQVIADALTVLREKQLEAYYLAAEKEIDEDFDATAFDGLEDETW